MENIYTFDWFIVKIMALVGMVNGNLLYWTLNVVLVTVKMKNVLDSYCSTVFASAMKKGLVVTINSKITVAFCVGKQAV